MKSKSSILLALFLLMFGLLPGAASISEAGGQQHTVIIEGMKFTPSSLTVKPGDQIIWVNQDFFPHTVTSPGNFDSKEIQAGKSWKFTARISGNFAYVCSLHPTMKAMLTILAK